MIEEIDDSGKISLVGKQIPLDRRPDPEHDTGHCLVGPIAVRDAQPGQVLQVDICQLIPAAEGATWVGEVQEFLPQLGVVSFPYFDLLYNRLDLDQKIQSLFGSGSSGYGEAFTSTTWGDGLDHIPVLAYYLTRINIQLQRSPHRCRSALFLRGGFERTSRTNKILTELLPGFF